jgi:hypothetical protein
LPENGKVVSFTPGSPTAATVASGAPLLVDVEFGRGNRLFALSQGHWEGNFEGDPAAPNTGSLVEVNGDGTFSVVESGLDRPTSMEIIGTNAYVITMAGEVRKITGVGAPPFGNFAAASIPGAARQETVRAAGVQPPLDASTGRQEASTSSLGRDAVFTWLADTEAMPWISNPLLARSPKRR